MDYVKVIVHVVQANSPGRNYSTEIHPQAKVSDLIAGFNKRVGPPDSKAHLLLELDESKTITEQVLLSPSTKLVLLIDKG